MKINQTYICETCGAASCLPEDIELCEAKHMGLTTLDEKHQWDKLNEAAKRATARLSTTNNQKLRDAEEQAYQDLLAFEKKHNMKPK